MPTSKTNNTPLLSHTYPPCKENLRSISEQPVSMEDSTLVLQPETRPISREQLVAEVKGICEYLGDLQRHRTAIDEEGVCDGAIWSKVARFWYSKAPDIYIAIGRLYHHLAILSREGGSRAALRRCIPDYNRNLARRPQRLPKLVAGTADGTNRVPVLEKVDVFVSLGVTGVISRMGESFRGVIADANTLLRRLSLSVRHVQCSRACALAMLTIYIGPVTAVAIKPGYSGAVYPASHSTTGPWSTANPVPTNLDLPPFPEWSFPILCGSILATCLLVAKLKRWEPSYVSGTLAAVSWWLWVYLKRDPNISPWFSWTYAPFLPYTPMPLTDVGRIWSMGATTTTYYSRLGFQDNHLSHRYIFPA